VSSYFPSIVPLQNNRSSSCISSPNPVFLKPFRRAGPGTLGLWIKDSLGLILSNLQPIPPEVPVLHELKLEESPLLRASR